MNVGEDRAHALDDVEQIGGGRHLDADIDRALAVETDLGFVIVGAERHIGHVLEADDGAVRLLHRQIAELVERMQAGRGIKVDLHHLALGVAQARDVIVAGERVRHVGCCDAVSGELRRVEPGTEREILPAQYLRGLHALDRLQLGLHHAQQIIGDLVRRQHVALEADIHGVESLADLDRQHRLLRSRRQLVQHRGHLGGDLGHRLVGVVIEPQIGGDGADSGLAGRGQVIDAVGLGDGVFQGRGDEPGHHLGIGAVIRGGNGDHRVLGARILQHRQRSGRAQPQHQDHQADHHGQNRPPDEDVGEIHRSPRLICRPVADWRRPPA